MYSLLPLALTCWSLLALAPATASPVGDLLESRALVKPNDILPEKRQLFPHMRTMIRRDAEQSFPFEFGVSELILFSGEWQATKKTPLSLDVVCVECKTFGTLKASAEFPDDLGDFLSDFSDFNPLNDASLTIGFEGVGGTFDIRISVDGDGQFTFPLFKSETPLGVSGPGFQVGITFNVDLILSVSAEISAESGFEVTIPDGASYTIPLDPSLPNIANFGGAETTLLPLTVDGPAEITAALRLRVQAGVDLPGNKLFDAQALVGAYLFIPEVTLTEEFTSSFDKNGSINEPGECLLPASAEININAGVFVDIGADIGNFDVADFNPTLSTTLFSVSTTTCFLTATGAEEPTPAPALGTGYVGTGVVRHHTRSKPKPKPTGVIGTGGSSAATPTVPAPGGVTSIATCPEPLVTEYATTTSTYSFTSCAAKVLNCPSSLEAVIVVVAPATLSSSHCPVSLKDGATIAPNAPYANATTTTITRGAPLPLRSLSSPIVNTLTIDPSVQAPPAASITGAPRTPKAAPTPPPSPASTPAPAPEPSAAATTTPKSAPAGPKPTAAPAPPAEEDDEDEGGDVDDEGDDEDAENPEVAAPSVIYETRFRTVTTTACPLDHLTMTASPSLRRRRPLYA